MSAAIKMGRATSQGGVGRMTRAPYGDPGLFGTLGGIVGSIIPGVGTAVGAGVGSIVDKITGGGGGGRRQGPTRSTTTTRTRPPFGGVFGGTERTTVTRRGFGPPMSPGPNGAAAGTKLACPSGYHPNKSGYYTHSEGWIPEGTKCVKNRRRNPANPRALDRAMGRLNSAKRLQSKLAGYSTPKYTKAGNRKDKCR